MISIFKFLRGAPQAQLNRRAFIIASTQWDPTTAVVPADLLAALKAAQFKLVVADKGSSKPDRKAHLRDAVVVVVGNPSPGQLPSLCETLRMLGNEPIIVIDAVGEVTDQMQQVFAKLHGIGIAMLTVAQLRPLLADRDLLAKAKALNQNEAESAGI